MKHASLDNVFVLSGPKAGPTVAIFGGVHGNETAGFEAIRELAGKIKLARGTLYLVIANPPAIKKGVRQGSKNLNRCFYKANRGRSYEDKRARELMKILDECEVLLDIHSFFGREGEPFIICEENALDLASKLEPAIISTNWAKAEPGATDGYMYEQGKIGLCFECGPISSKVKTRNLAIKTVWQFLSYMELLDKPVALNKKSKRIVKAERAVIRTSKDYVLYERFNNFQRLLPRHPYGAQAGKKFVASKGECIIFPRPDPPIGTEAFLIGKEQKEAGRK